MQILRAALTATALTIGCSTAPNAIDGGSDGGTTPLVNVLFQESNGLAAQIAFTDHIPTAAEVNQVGAFLAYSIAAQQSGGLDEGFVASSLVTDLQQIALEYPDFFVAFSDGGGFTIKPRFIDGTSQIACGVSCEPSAAAFTSAVGTGIPPLSAALSSPAAAVQASVDQAAAALGDNVAQSLAFDSAIADAGAGAMDSFLSQFAASVAQPGELSAAANLLGFDAGEVQDLDDTVAAIWAVAIASAGDTALIQAGQLEQLCVSYQAQSCGLATSSSGSSSSATAATGATSGATSGTVTAATSAAASSGTSGGGVSSAASSSSGSSASVTAGSTTATATSSGASGSSTGGSTGSGTAGTSTGG